MSRSEYQRMYRVLATTQEMIKDRGYFLADHLSAENLAATFEDKAKNTFFRSVNPGTQFQRQGFHDLLLSRWSDLSYTVHSLVDSEDLLLVVFMDEESVGIKTIGW